MGMPSGASMMQGSILLYRRHPYFRIRRNRCLLHRIKTDFLEGGKKFSNTLSCNMMFTLQPKGYCRSKLLSPDEAILSPSDPKTSNSVSTKWAENERYVDGVLH